MNTIRRMHRHGLKGCPRRKVYSWPKKGFVVVRWGGFFLTFRILPFRGLSVIAVRRGNFASPIIWREPFLEEDE